MNKKKAFSVLRRIYLILQKCGGPGGTMGPCPRLGLGGSLHSTPSGPIPSPPNVLKPDSKYAPYYSKLQDKFNSIHEAAKIGDIAKIQAMKINASSTDVYTQRLHAYREEVLRTMNGQGGPKPGEEAKPITPTVAPVRPGGFRPPKNPPPKPSGDKPSSKGITAGKHIIRQGADHDEVLRMAGDLNEKTKGNLAKFLEKHPVTIKVNDYVGHMRSSEGLYWPSADKIDLRVLSKVQDPAKMVRIGGEGFSVSSDKSIQVYKKSYNKKAAKEANRESTFVHEMGHHIDYKLRKADPKFASMLREAFHKVEAVSTYAKTNDKEYFAEAFAARMGKVSVHPEVKKLVDYAVKRMGGL